MVPGITYFPEIECDECGEPCSQCRWCAARQNIQCRWCPACQSKAFKRAFNSWTSGNLAIDELIKYTQLNPNECRGYLEWIPPESLFIDKQLSEGAFSTFFLGKWIEGPRCTWDEEENRWIRSGPTECGLKRIDCSDKINQDYLNNILKHHQCLQGRSMVDCFGITREPETGSYMFVVKLCEENLYKYLKRNMRELSWQKKVKMLYKIAGGLKQIHDCRLYHGNLHGGNLLTETTVDGVNIRISDTGLHGPPDRTSAVYGVLSFVAPEVLKGGKCTQASDIYSFGIIMSTFSTCIPPFNQIPHDLDLAIRICKGLRPKIYEDTPKIYLDLMERCWHQDPNKRLKITELYNNLSNLVSVMRDDPTSSISQQFAAADRANSKKSIIPKSQVLYNSKLISFEIP
ncbi:kinase-like domain-containing protein [Gigaspora rosea]|uniref:Kinase-like domain-containing protein n=1 Tax=Gigaspora rosea TaxID=44941 RepID=A0A397W0D6_9GLOM|nr:kinase-like domain-containing protein [Gigaspora rosea]